MFDLENVAVIGAGTMGHGIAQVASLAGFSVRLCDERQEALDGAVARIRDGVERALEKGRLTPAEKQRTLDGILVTTDLEEAVTSADLVVEAVPEDLALKRALLARVAGLCRASALIASNTSSIAIADLSAGLPQPGRFLGLHFFNPVPVMELLEIVRAPDTAAHAVEAARAFAARLGKTAIEVRDSPGFATSRLGVALGLEAMRLLEEGVASAADIDRAMELGYRHPMGPLRLTDLVGLDVRLAIAEYLHQKLGSARFEPPAILRRLVAEGKLGKKSGRGFYEW
ncbi:3-hydroxyacyl-CoA dehydrogenase family protein [Anaeromyxobacter paludicola]|uniref:3-hydroxyacyl-CoA dehydrogenase n=1 Tax=Anaeromyxobacter paludicola TaxID=2918171 RepID=A0ABN6NC24_9BACT|nr:3-hydroxyacyl-CoA dehydrogenase family protein [Anaeromyxobacter paludicola]BDG10812.1 putative 3-hydroxyacyl-CoA dehydrogenase [Anaeromyxobacter paludicola]